MSDFQCPRRSENPPLPNYPDLDEWHDRGGIKTCSYCGSMSPDDFLDAVRKGVEITPTDKSYKAYVPGTGKFYFQHLSPEQRETFIELYNDKTMKLGYPGHFYTRPFFAASEAAKV